MSLKLLFAVSFSDLYIYIYEYMQVGRASARYAEGPGFKS